MTTKTELKFFFITDFEEEAKYLMAMHRKGWRLTKIRFRFLYNFEKTNPEEVVYRLDFKDNGRDDQEAYYQLYQDYGWEPVANCNNFEIFRKPASQVGEDDIFSDETSRWEMIRQIFMKRFLLGLTFFVFPIYHAFSNKNIWMLVALLLMIVPITSYLLYRFYQLKKKYGGN